MGARVSDATTATAELASLLFRQRDFVAVDRNRISYRRIGRLPAHRTHGAALHPNVDRAAADRIGCSNGADASWTAASSYSFCVASAIRGSVVPWTAPLHHASGGGLARYEPRLSRLAYACRIRTDFPIGKLARFRAPLLFRNVRHVLVGGAESLAKPSTLAAVGSDSLPAERRCGEHNVIGVSGILRTCPLSFVRCSTTCMSAYTIAGPSRGWIGNVDSEFNRLPYSSISLDDAHARSPLS